MSVGLPSAERTNVVCQESVEKAYYGGRTQRVKGENGSRARK